MNYDNLYNEMIRILSWLSAFVAIPFIILSKDFLALWIGPEYMVNSGRQLALAGGVVWRSPKKDAEPRSEMISSLLTWEGSRLR
jgi:hypothetical protein